MRRETIEAKEKIRKKRKRVRGENYMTERNKITKKIGREIPCRFCSKTKQRELKQSTAVSTYVQKTPLSASILLLYCLVLPLLLIPIYILQNKLTTQSKY
jgi:hypothetical protein